MSDSTQSNGGNPIGPRKIPSVFALASRPMSVGASIDVSDVLQMRPNWTRQQAAAFLSANATVIADEMEMSGSAVLIALLAKDSNVN
jgi:hypothetical protein